ncbi:MAG: glycosyltransferase [Candidatus Rokuibacteriota bacterium]
MSGEPGLVVGILPALGSGLTDLRRSGQHERLLAYDLRHYARGASGVIYFSYFDERLEDFTDDPALLSKVVLRPRRGPWPARLYALLLPLLLRHEFRRCDVLRVMQLSGVIPALVARWLYRTPFVVTYGYHYGEVARLAGSRLKPWLYRLVERVALPRAAAVIVTSPELQALLTARPRPPRVVLVPNGVDVRAFSPAAAGAPSGRRVLFVGRLEPEKNLERLIDALASLATPARLEVIGDGRLRRALERRAVERGVRAEFVGTVPHGALPEYFRRADLFVLPSLTEGHPKALIEAMASGLPCAVSARGGNPTLVTDGVSGLLFDPEDVGAIAGALERVLDDPHLARRLGAGARAAAVARFDAETLLTEEVRVVAGVARTAPLTRLFEEYAHAFPIDDELPQFVVSRLEALAGAGPRAVLDVGAGDGRYVDFFASRLPAGALVVGCELSFSRARRIRARGLRVVTAEAERLPFRGGSFDLVTLVEVIEHTRSPAGTMDEIRRVLRPGGRLALTTPNYPVKRLYDARAALRTRNLRRLRDDPTHISPLSAPALQRLLRARFDAVRLEGTALLGEGRIPWIRRLKDSPLGRCLSNKLFAVCVRGREGS